MSNMDDNKRYLDANEYWDKYMQTDRDWDDGGRHKSLPEIMKDFLPANARSFYGVASKLQKHIDTYEAMPKELRKDLETMIDDAELNWHINDAFIRRFLEPHKFSF